MAPHNATVVVGIGEAGTKIASDLYDDIEQMYQNEPEDFHDYFKFIGIDSREEDLEDFSREGFAEISLDPHPGAFDRLKDKLPFLTDSHEIERAGGATRQRPVSRYYIDNERNFDKFHNELSTSIRNFLDRTPAGGQVNVWVVNAFGGGTGSGAFPLVTAMLDSMDTAWQDRSIWLGGIGSLPRLDRLRQIDSPPANDPDLYANAYTALRELAVLTDYEFRDADSGKDQHRYKDAGGVDYPIEIPVYADASEMTNEAYVLEEPPFEFYGLMGVQESRSESNIRELNKIAGDLILFFSEVRGAEDWGSGLTEDIQGNEILFSLTGGHIEVPVDDLRPYIELIEEIDEKHTELAKIRREINRYRVNRDLLNELVDYEPGTGPTDSLPLGTTVYDPDTGETEGIDDRFDLPSEDSEDENSARPDEEEWILEVGIDAHQAWEQMSEGYSHAEQAAQDFPKEYNPDVLDERVDNVLEGTVSFTDDLMMDSDTVTKYLYYQELLRNYREQRANHRFEDEIETVWADHENNIRENVDKLDVSIHEVNELIEQGDPIASWEEVLEEYFELRVEIAKETKESAPFYAVSRKRELEEEIEERKSRLRTLRNDYREYNNIETAIQDIEPRRDEEEQALDQIRLDLQKDLREDLSTEHQTLREKLSNKQTKKERREAKLQRFEEGRFMSIPLDDFSEVTPDVLDEYDSIVDLFGNVVKQRDVLRALEHVQQEELEEELEDRDDYTPFITNLKWYIGGLGHEDDIGILEGEYDVEGMSVESWRESDQEQFWPIPDSFRLRLVGMILNTRLENMSELGTIHEIYRSDEELLSEEFGFEEDDDEFVTNKFAYPELFVGKDERIEQHFGLGTVETNMD